MISKRVILIVAMLFISAGLFGWQWGKWVVDDLHAAKHHMQDCDHVKETCNRKKGCKCKLNCDPEGRRLPPAGGAAECPSYCCEEKCECHPMGCP